jgi:hypothetical protein
MVLSDCMAPASFTGPARSAIADRAGIEANAVCEPILHAFVSFAQAVAFTKSPATPMGVEYPAWRQQYIRSLYTARDAMLIAFGTETFDNTSILHAFLHLWQNSDDFSTTDQTSTLAFEIRHQGPKKVPLFSCRIFIGIILTSVLTSSFFYSFLGCIYIYIYIYMCVCICLPTDCSKELQPS